MVSRLKIPLVVFLKCTLLILLSELFIKPVGCYNTNLILTPNTSLQLMTWVSITLIGTSIHPPVQQVLLLSVVLLRFGVGFFLLFLAAFSWCDLLSAAIYTRHISFNETVQCLLERACEWSSFCAFFPFFSLSFCFFLLSNIHS